MNASVLRKELNAYIEIIPEYRLEILKPLLADLAETEFIVESDLNDEEKTIIAEGSKRFKEHPEEFTRLEDFLERHSISL
jgi:hypothetical protein